MTVTIARLRAWISEPPSWGAYIWRAGILCFGTLMFATQCVCAWVEGIALTWSRSLQFLLLAEATGVLVGVVMGWPVVRRYSERADRERSRH